MLTLALLSIALCLLSAALSLFGVRRPGLIYHIACPLLIMAGALAVYSGIATLISGQSIQMTMPWGLPWLHWQVRIDVLSGFFLCVMGLVLMPVGLYAKDYIKAFEGSTNSLAPLGFFTGIFVASMLMVILADDAFSFMFAWEIMSLSSYFLVVYEHEESSHRRAAFLYLLMAQISGLLILLSFGVLAGASQGFGFEIIRQTNISSLQAGSAFILALLGFGLKAGLVPLHVWLPEAHPVAPSHISALMSAVMLKVSVYGFIRIVFDLIPELKPMWGVGVLLVGTFSGFFGILMALMQNDIKRILAYSSVENIGIIFIGLGLSIIFSTHHLPELSALAFIAALFHVLNHGVYKSLLFMGAGAVLHATHERDLDKMGALVKTMPWTAACFLVGCLSIAALPPLNGFVSEWLNLRAFLEAWQLQGGILRSIVPLCAALLAITGALAAACFIKVFGIGFLGQARTKSVKKAKEVSLSMRISLVFLAVLCLLLGVFAGPVIHLLNTVSEYLLHASLSNISSRGFFQLTPLAANVASYNPALIALGFVIFPLILRVILTRFNLKVRKVEPWDCGFAPPSSRMQYTSIGFAQPFRRLFGLLFKVDEQLEQGEGKKRYRLSISDRFWDWIYLPIAKWVQLASRKITGIQSGNIRGYLAWSLFTLIVILWWVTWRI
jgi:formate hydrogenlyase subunit 3/multisubunit Na+/H+ antiporter MnhD subunit